MLFTNITFFFFLILYLYKLNKLNTTYLHNINLQDNAYKTGANELEPVTK